MPDARPAEIRAASAARVICQVPCVGSCQARNFQPADAVTSFIPGTGGGGIGISEMLGNASAHIASERRFSRNASSSFGTAASLISASARSRNPGDRARRRLAACDSRSSRQCSSAFSWARLMRQAATFEPTTIAATSRTTELANAPMAGCRLHHRHASSDRFKGRAMVGFPSRKRLRSSASSPAVAYRCRGSFSIARAEMSMRSR